MVKQDEDVHVAQRCLLTTGEGAENPCFHDGLRLEVVGYSLLHHFGTHKHIDCILGHKGSDIFLINVL